MGIVFPNAATARRWDGALQARLSRAPLEKYLRTRGIAPAGAGLSQDSDDIARATVHLLDPVVMPYIQKQADGFGATQRAFVGQLACVTSTALAHLIAQPNAWRIAALMSGARLLSRWIGLTEAALASASAVRSFHKCTVDCLPTEPDFAACIVAALDGRADFATALLLTLRPPDTDAVIA